MTSNKKPKLRKSRSQAPSELSSQSAALSKYILSAIGRKGVSAPKAELDFFRHMIEQMGDDVMVLDKQGRIVFVNSAMVKAMGYAKKNILNRSVTDFMKKKISVRQWQKTYFMEAKRKRKPISYRADRVIKSGKIRTIDVTAVYMPYGSQEFILVVGRDISEQSAFQEKLKQSEDRYRLLSEQAAEGILMINMEGVILYANKAAANIFKLPPHKIVGTPFGKYMNKPSMAKAWGCFTTVKGGEPSMCNDLDIKDSDGRIIPAEFMASPIMSGKKVTQVHVIFRDMSQRKKIEMLIRESEKMKALQNFVAGMTREIRQPLEGLLNRSQSLIDKYKDRHFEYIGYKEFSDIMKTLHTMNDQVKYCFDTADRIIGLSRKKAKLADYHCSVNSVILESVGLLKHSLEVSDTKLKLKLSSLLPHVAIEALDLGQAINNVLTNAIQSLPSGGGKIQIKTTYQKAIDSVRIDCQDDGVGIPKEVLDRVFEPFFTTKPRGLEKSSGLGLSIVYSIIKNHQGEVKITSDFRKGTFVTILLPVYRAKKKSRSR